MHSVASSDGVDLAIHHQGEGARSTLLCHATGFHGAVWEPLSEALGDGFDRWAIDFRAHGASVVAEGSDLDWSRTCADVLAAVDGRGLRAGEVLGIGHSMGGAALFLAEQARPGTFAGLWVYEPIAAPAGFLQARGKGGELADAAARRRDSFPSRADALANFASKPPLNVLRSDVLHAYVRHGFVDTADGEVRIACRPEDESRTYRGGGTHGAFARLAAVTCPVVVACGGEAHGPAAFAPLLAEELPHGRLERHEHIGHFGPLESPAILASSIRHFAAAL